MCSLAIGVDEERIHQVDIGIVGVPRDGGTTNRLGGRHGPRQLCDLGIKPMTVGGENLISLPILRALSEKSPLNVIHLDAHTDLFDEYFGGCKITHGTPFRRAIEEGLLNPTRVIQIGIRGTTCDGADVEWGLGQGVRIITMEEVLDRWIDDVMSEAHRNVDYTSTYVSFDIDCIDPSFAPGQARRKLVASRRARLSSLCAVWQG